MLNAHINIVTAFALSAAGLAPIAFFLVIARFLAPLVFRGRRYSPVDKGSYSLPLHGRQSASNGLRRVCSRRDRLDRNWHDFHVGPTLQENHSPMINILLHNWNEERVKPFMIKYILGKFNLAGLYLRPVMPRRRTQ